VEGGVGEHAGGGGAGLGVGQVQEGRRGRVGGGEACAAGRRRRVSGGARRGARAARRGTARGAPGPMTTRLSPIVGARSRALDNRGEFELLAAARLSLSQQAPSIATSVESELL
jgi:hypothetical protein